MTAIVLPNDLQDEAYEDPPHAHGTLRSGVGYSAPKVVPHDAELARAAEILNSGGKIAMLIGAGALGAADEVIAVADRLSAGCAKALLGKAALPDDLPWVTGSIGLLGTEPSYKMMNECDTLLMVAAQRSCSWRFKCSMYSTRAGSSPTGKYLSGSGAILFLVVMGLAESSTRNRVLPEGWTGRCLSSG